MNAVNKDFNQVCRSVFIWYGSGSSIFGWIPIRIWIQSGSGVLMTKNWKKLHQKFFLFFLFYQNYNVPIPRPPKRTSSHKRSLQLSKENIQHFKTRNFLIFSYFCGSLLTSWIRIRIPNTDPDSLSWFNPDPIRIRISDPDFNGFQLLVMVVDVRAGEEGVFKSHLHNRSGYERVYSRLL